MKDKLKKFACTIGLIFSYYVISESSVGKKQKQLGIFKYDDRCRIEYDGMIFDSREERDCYIILRDAGFNIIQLDKKIENLLYTQNGIRIEPDFLIQNNGKVNYAEYFGLYVNNPSSKRQLQNYARTMKKLDFFKSNDLNFIAIYPEDLKQSLIGENSNQKHPF